MTWERKRVGQRITFEKLRDRISAKINEPRSHGTMVELCVPRNRRHRSSSRYKSVANVVSKRARNGFDIELNIDEKWSNSLYASLNALQLQEHSNALYLYRDDAARFRLDTMATSSKFPTLMLRGSVDMATRTDFTNKEHNVLQVSSYCFTGSQTSDHEFAGVVKASKIDSKNQAQHVADLEMLFKNNLFHDNFFRKDGK